MPITSTALPRGRSRDAADLQRRADWIRLETIRLIHIAGSGHYTSVFSAAEVFASLYYHALRIDPQNPSWADRDRFLLGKGHAAVGLYPCLADLGFFPAEWLDEYTRLGSPLGDHPDMTRVPGVDFSSGSIGHNLSVGLGIALASRLRGSDALTYVMLGDGELHEGQVWEAAMAASHHRVRNLIAIVDANGWCLDGRANEVMGIEPIAGRFEAFGWRTVEIDGHDVSAVTRALDDLGDIAGGAMTQPTCIVARTQKGRGVSFMEGEAGWHLGFLGEHDRQIAIDEIAGRRA